MIKLNGISRFHISSPNATVVMGCELSISVSKNQLSDCLGKLCNAHQLVNKIVKIDEHDEAYLTSSPTFDFDIIEYKNQPYEVIASIHLKDEWKLEQSLIKFIINHVTDTSCQIIVSCNHAICDGLSLVYLLEDIASYFHTGIVPAEKKITTLHPYKMQKQNSTLLVRLLAFVINRNWKKNPLKLSQDLLSRIYEAYWQKHDAKVETIALDKNQTLELINAARKNRVTVNTYLTHLLHQSQLKLSDRPFQNQAIISVNLRDKLITNPNRQLGYFVTGVRVSLPKFSKQPNSDHLKKLQVAIQNKLQPKPLLTSLASYFFNSRFFDAVQLNKFYIRNDSSIQKFIAKKGGGEINTAFAFTNLGVIRANDSCKDILIKFLPLTLVSDTMEKYVSAFTYRERLQLAICYDPTLISENEIDKFKNSVIALVRQTSSNE